MRELVNGTAVQPVLAEWPSTMTAVLDATYGPSRHVEPLGGMSRGRTWRIRFDAASIIVKHTAQHREVAFYTQVAPQVPLDLVPRPRLLWADLLQAPGWLMLEDIPLPFPRQRWHADPTQLTILHHLHHLTLHQPTDVFQPAWTEELTRGALACFPPAMRHELGPILARVQAHAQPLFQPQCWISGDPNPTNWGVQRMEPWCSTIGSVLARALQQLILR